MNLKTTLITGAFALLNSNYSISQDLKHEIGIHSGGSLSAYLGYQASHTFDRANSGVFYGIGYQWNLKKHFSLRTEMNSERKGSIRQANGSPSSRTYTNLDYFTLPVFCQFHFGNRVQYFLQFGPYISGLSKAVERFPKTAGNNYQESINDVGYRYTQYEIGASLGTGIATYVSPHLKLFLECRYNQGITYLLHHSKHSNSSNMRNFSLTGLAGLHYCFGKKG